MNKERRKKLTELVDKLDVVYTAIEELIGEEQDALDNTPDSLQGTERCEAMESAIGHLEDAMTSLDDVRSSIESAAE